MESMFMEGLTESLVYVKECLCEENTEYICEEEYVKPILRKAIARETYQQLQRTHQDANAPDLD